MNTIIQYIDRRFWISFLFVTAAFTGVVAHSARETNAVIQNADGSTIVLLDVPWTINKSARDYLQIEDGDRTSDEETYEYLVRYITQHFKLFVDGSQLVVKRHRMVPQDHSHSLLLEFTFNRTELNRLEIYNALMIDQFGSRQENHIKLLFRESDYLKFQTQEEVLWIDIKELLNEGTESNIAIVKSTTMKVILLISLGLFFILFKSCTRRLLDQSLYLLRRISNT